MENIMDARRVFDDLKDYLENSIPISVKSLEGTILPDNVDVLLRYSNVGAYKIVDNNKTGEKIEATVVRTDLFCENEYIYPNDQVYILELKLIKGTGYDNHTIYQETNGAFTAIALMNQIHRSSRRRERVRVMMLDDLRTSLHLQDPNNIIQFDFDYLSLDGRTFTIEAEEKNKHLKFIVEYRLAGDRALIESVSIWKGEEYDRRS